MGSLHSIVHLRVQGHFLLTSASAPTQVQHKTMKMMAVHIPTACIETEALGIRIEVERIGGILGYMRAAGFIQEAKGEVERH